VDNRLVNKHVVQRLGVEKSGSEFKVLKAPKALNLRGLREGVELGALAGLAAWGIFQQVGGTTWTLKTDSGSTPNSDLVGFVIRSCFERSVHAQASQNNRDVTDRLKQIMYFNGTAA